MSKTFLLLGLGAVTYALVANNLNPEVPPDPMDKIYFGTREYSVTGPVRSKQIEVDTADDCIELATRAFAKVVGDGYKAIEVRCVKEVNSEKPL